MPKRLVSFCSGRVISTPFYVYWRADTGITGRDLVSFFATAPLFANLLLLFGLSLFFGLAFEEFHAHQGRVRPGGVRTFPLLASAGAMLYLLDPARLVPLSAGLLVIGAWLYAYYRSAVEERDSEGVPNVGLVGPVCNLLAYLLGPVALTQPHWVAVGMTVASVLLLTGRERLHAAAQRIEPPEIVTAGKFLILTGIILPLLPDEPITALTTVTPYQAWLALLAVCTLSYASYLLLRYWVPKQGDYLTAILGGLYSSTATTVVLARRAGAKAIAPDRAKVGIVLATAVMYLRTLGIIAVFNLGLAAILAPALVGLALLGLSLAALLSRRAGQPPNEPGERAMPSNPLELWAAALFATLFVAVSIASGWVVGQFGAAGVYALAAIVGVTDIDPFVLSIAQGGAGSLSKADATIAVLVATASNNVLKAAYTVGFVGLRGSLPAVASLALLSGAAISLALIFVRH
ncbi:MAG: MgtC/SapB family protein [Hyphomicrobiales bacterium]